MTMCYEDSMGKEIRFAEMNDVPVLAKMLGELFSMDHEFSADPAKQEKGLREIIGNENNGRVFVLVQGDEVLGMVSILFSISTALGGRVAVLEDMFIRSDHRWAGNGSLLLKAAISWCASNGILRLTLLTDHNNTPAAAFYKKHGFTKSAMIPLRMVF